jgi:hypothetical protein
MRQPTHLITSRAHSIVRSEAQRPNASQNCFARQNSAEFVCEFGKNHLPLLVLLF